MLSAQLLAPDSDPEPIARFTRSWERLDSSAPTNGPLAGRNRAELLLDPRAEPILDLIVVSFLSIERKRRGREQAASNTARFAGASYFQMDPF